MSSLEFRSYRDNLNLLHAQSVLRCVEGIPQQEMIQNIVSMTEKLKGDISHPFLQQLQLARQLESLSKIRDEHILNTAKWLVDEGMVSLRMTAWREIVRIAYCLPLPRTRPSAIKLDRSKDSAACCARSF